MDAPRWLPGPSDPFYRRVFALAAALTLGLALYQIIGPFLQPLAWATILALLLYPLQVRLARRLGGRLSLGPSQQLGGVCAQVALPLFRDREA